MRLRPQGLGPRKGQAHSALLEKHRNLSRIRIASHLAILDGREMQV